MADKDIERRVASLARVPGLANAEVSGEKHTATVVFDDQKTTVAALISATTNAGYPSRPAPWRERLAVPCGGTPLLALDAREFEEGNGT